MTLPIISPGQDPGPSFSELLRRQNGDQPLLRNTGAVEITHGTTIVALRYTEGVIMAGDRRATEGYSIASRAIDKVFPADGHSGVAIAGAAGPAVELEHYEKVEGVALSLEGKANQLGGMIRRNLPMAMEGLAVVPIYAGYDLRRQIGRIFKYDLTGGRYEEGDFHATGSGGRDARTTIKLGYREGLDRAAAIQLAVEGLYQAADEDSATGGPDVVRGIYPTVATITAGGFERVEDTEVAQRFGELLQRKTSEGHPR
jgi:proteasome beta subunit